MATTVFNYIAAQEKAEAVLTFSDVKEEVNVRVGVVSSQRP